MTRFETQIVDEPAVPHVQERFRCMEKLWGASQFAKIDLVLKNNEGKIVAGLRAERRWAGTKLDYLFVNAERRGQGLGRYLVRQLELRAAALGCRFVRLETSSDEAPAFYKAIGYETYGKVEDIPHGHRIVLLDRSLSVVSEDGGSLPSDVVLSDQPTDEDVARVEDLLDEFSAREAGPPGFAPFSVELNKGSSVVGRAGGLRCWNALVPLYFWVNESERGRGGGGQMLQLLKDMARTQGVDRILGWTFSPESGFFLASGFEKIGSSHGYPKNGTSDVLQLPLGRRVPS